MERAHTKKNVGNYILEIIEQSFFSIKGTQAKLFAFTIMYSKFTQKQNKKTLLNSLLWGKKCLLFLA